MEDVIATPSGWWQGIQITIMVIWMCVTWHLYKNKGRFKEGVGGSSLAALIGLAIVGNFVPTDFQNDGLLLYVKWRYMKEAWRNGDWQLEIPLTLIGIVIYVIIAWPGALFW